jgi:multidrug efflux pump subunit AcrB
MSTAMGGAFVNDFNQIRRLYRVYVQAESSDRLHAEDIGRIYVRSRTTNAMIPLSTLVTVKRYRWLRDSHALQLVAFGRTAGCARPRLHFGSGSAALEEVFAQTMPKEMSFAYSSLSYQEKIAPPPAPT